MRKYTFLFLWIVLASTFFSKTVDAQGPVPGCPGAFGPVKHIYGTHWEFLGQIDYGSHRANMIKQNTHWVKDTIYILHKSVIVSTGVTLTIDAGTIIMGFPAPQDTSLLVIQNGAKIIANGTPSLPIVFTSCKLQGSRNAGDWVGVIVCGLAPSNKVKAPYYYPIRHSSFYGTYHGGNNSMDNSGSLKYVRIEYAGLDLDYIGKTFYGGLTLCAVGRSTILNHIQVSQSGKDSFSWWGGTVNSTNLISWKCKGNDFDVNLGHSGSNQFGLGFRDPEKASDFGSFGINVTGDWPRHIALEELAGDGECLVCDEISIEEGHGAQRNGIPNNEIQDIFANDLPRTTSVFSNYELWGPQLTSVSRFNTFHKAAVQINNGGIPSIYNTLFIGWPSRDLSRTAGVSIDGLESSSGAITDTLKVRNCVSASYLAPIHIPALTDVSEFWSSSSFGNIINWFKFPAYHNLQFNSVINLNKKAPFKQTPLFTLNGGSLLATGSSWNTGTTPALSGAPFLAVAYRGAFSGTDWTADWTEFTPNLFVYTAGQPTRKAKFEALNDALPDHLTVSPNPASGSATLNFYFHNDAVGKIAVYDMNGAEAMTQDASFTRGNNTVPLNISALQSGLYIVKVMTVNGDVKVAKLEVK